jgi:hypothetical protein
MFNDIKTSRDTMHEFKAKMAEAGVDLGLDLSVQVRMWGHHIVQAPATVCMSNKAKMAEASNDVG